jgi:hypothetical protein
MKKYLKIFAALMLVTIGAICVSHYFIHPVSYSAMFVGIGGIMLLYPAVIAYVNMFDNLFGE